MSATNAVIFDMDGVLIDSEIAYRDLHQRFFASRGVEVSIDEWNLLAGSSRKVERRYYEMWWERSLGERLSGEEIAALEHEYSKRNPIDHAAIMNPGVPETLAALRERGLRLALASSSPLHYIRKVLDVCGLAEFFEVVESGDELKQSKPHPEIYLLTLEKLGLPASSCCAVEDSDYGIEAARSAGIYTIAKREERFNFTQAEANAIVDGIPDVIGVVEDYLGDAAR